jgi:phage tail sheath protein FI
MAEYLHPGVYVQEKSSGVKPIEGVGTSTAAFIGVTAKGVPNKATFITSWAQFVRKFGYLIAESYLPYAVRQFFDNGGKRCYVVRVLSAAAAVGASVNLLTRESNTPARAALRVRALGSGAWGNTLGILVEDGSANPLGEFKLSVTQADEKGAVQSVEVFDDLSMDPNAANYVETQINGASELIEVEDLFPSTARAGGAAIHATAVTTGPLNDPVNIGAGVVVFTGPDGNPITIDLTTLTAPVTPAAVVDRFNTSLASANVTASLTTAAGGGAAGRLQIRHNVAGYDAYFTIGMAGANGDLAGLASYQQGAGAAIGALLKSNRATTFDTSGGNNLLTITVHGDALPPAVTPITLPVVGAATPIDDIVGAIRTAFSNTGVRGLLTVRREGDRVVIETANKGAGDTQMTVAGTGASALGFARIIPGAYAAGDTVVGQGRNEPAFVVSGPAPFSVEPNANFTIVTNNGVLGVNSAPVSVTFTAGPAFPNLEQVTAQQLATAITTAGAGQVTATAVAGRVVVTQVRRGRYYRLTVNDGLSSPNIKLKFSGETRSGSEDGDPASSYFRPGANLVGGANTPWALVGGSDGSPVSNFDLKGTPDRKSGLHALDDCDDVNFVCIPGAVDPDVIDTAVGYCARRGDCFYIADAPGKRDKNSPLTDPARVQDFARNKLKVKESYGALYYPWLEIADPEGPGRNPRRFVPPSGFIAGLYARIDTTRGVWKAPAGTEAGVYGAIGLEYSTTDAEQDLLNPIGVNCIRTFADSGMVVWGARTLAAQKDPEYRYVPVRRYTNYLKSSIYRGTQWAVFEPNDAPLWEALKANIDDFMMGEFRRGALAGSVPEDAFDVKCDADLNPASEVNAGRVNMQVAFAPLKPAEFVIITISQKTRLPQG